MDYPSFDLTAPALPALALPTLPPLGAVDALGLDGNAAPLRSRLDKRKRPRLPTLPELPTGEPPPGGALAALSGAGAPDAGGPPAPQQPPPPADSPGFLSYIASTLDKPGNAVRSLLSGHPLDALASITPFSGALGLYDDKTQHHSGQDVNEALLGIPKDDDFLSGPGLAGFGTELLTDPLTWLPGFAGLKAATPVGDAARVLGGHLDEAASLGKAALKEAAGRAAADAAAAGFEGADVAAMAAKAKQSVNVAHPLYGDVLRAGQAVPESELAANLANLPAGHEIGDAARTVLGSNAERGTSALRPLTEAGDRVRAGQEAFLSAGGDVEPLGLFGLGGNFNPINWLGKVPGVNAPLHLPHVTIAEAPQAAQAVQDAWRAITDNAPVNAIKGLFAPVSKIAGKPWSYVKQVNTALGELKQEFQRSVGIGQDAAREEGARLASHIAEIQGEPGEIQNSESKIQNEEEPNPFPETSGGPDVPTDNKLYETMTKFNDAALGAAARGSDREALIAQQIQKERAAGAKAETGLGLEGNAAEVKTPTELPPLTEAAPAKLPLEEAAEGNPFSDVPLAPNEQPKSSWQTAKTGEPIKAVGYHGTGAVYDAPRGEMYYSADPEVANKYAENPAAFQGGRRPNVRFESIDLKNPYVIDFKGSTFDDFQGEHGSFWQTRQWAKENGYDGIVYHNSVEVRGGPPRTNVVVFKPETSVGPRTFLEDIKDAGHGVEEIKAGGEPAAVEANQKGGAGLIQGKEGADAATRGAGALHQAADAAVEAADAAARRGNEPSKGGTTNPFLEKPDDSRSLAVAARVDPREEYYRGAREMLGEEFARDLEAVKNSTAPADVELRGHIERAIARLPQMDEKEMGYFGVLPPEKTNWGKPIGEPPKVGVLPIDELHTDPERFQYKLSPGQGGNTGSLKGREWNPQLKGTLSVWEDPENGKTYVVNGHNRLHKGVQAGEHEFPVQYLNAETAGEARKMGAMENIAEGKGTPFDAAMFFKESGMGPDEARAAGLNLSDATAQQGLGLAALEPSLFTKALRGEMGQERAAIIGSKIADHGDQVKLAKYLDRFKKRNVSDAAVSELADMFNSSPTRTTKETGLFGTDERAESLALEKAKLTASIKERLRKEAGLFGFAGDEAKAGKIENAGAGHLETGKARAISQKAKEDLEAFKAYKQNILAGELNHGAERIGNGEKFKAVERETFERIRERLAGEDVAGGVGADGEHLRQARNGGFLRDKDGRVLPPESHEVQSRSDY